jgi:hypothetical protein
MGNPVFIIFDADTAPDSGAYSRAAGGGKLGKALN